YLICWSDLHVYNIILYLLFNLLFSFFFFFSSRRRHTRSTRDWSSDVCSSDLPRIVGQAVAAREQPGRFLRRELGQQLALLVLHRSEERRVGKECRSRWRPYQ